MDKAGGLDQIKSFDCKMSIWVKHVKLQCRIKSNSGSCIGCSFFLQVFLDSSRYHRGLLESSTENFSLASISHLCHLQQKLRPNCSCSWCNFKNLISLSKNPPTFQAFTLSMFQCYRPIAILQCTKNKDFFDEKIQP